MTAPATTGLERETDLGPVIRVRGLCKRYGSTLALGGIDLDVERGEILGLIGPDGAGKSTLFKILSGVMLPSEGEVEVLGGSARDARGSISFLTQPVSIYLDLSVDENLSYSAGLRNIPATALSERRNRYLPLMGLDRFGSRLAGQLSGGMKQKLALVCALVCRPRILLLDEPTTGIDPVSRRELWDVLVALSGEEMTVVVATPYLEEAERCHRVALIRGGQVLESGPPEQLRRGLGLERLEIRTPEPVLTERLLQTAIAGSSQLVDLQPFGEHLDLLVKEAGPAEAEICALLESRHLPAVSVRRTLPTLENVFVSRLRDQESNAPAVTFVHSRPVHSDGQVALAARGLSKSFQDFQAVDRVELEVNSGEIYGLLGANGAGKTTTIKMLCGLVTPSAGEVRLLGQPIDLKETELRRHIGYMSQKFTLYDDLSIVQNLEFYCGIYGVPARRRRERIDWVLTVCGLTGQEQLLTGRLPGGWKQRVAFGASVMHEPEMLFLDEPTSGVDPLARRQFWRSLEAFARHGMAILVTTHHLEEAEHCHRLGFMSGGRLVAQGTPSQLRAAEPGQLFELVLEDQTVRATSLLKATLEPWRVSTFGNRLHLVLDDPETACSEIMTLLHSNDLKIRSFEQIPFSLEDAFIGIVQRASRGES